MIKLDRIKHRINTTGKRGSVDYATCLIYIDARTAAEELDELFGVLNWNFAWSKEEGEKWAVRGTLSVRNPKLKQWIDRSDVGYPQEGKKYKKSDETQWLKDAVSDALKRCAVLFGVGRFLYDAPFLYTENVVVDGRTGKVRRLSPKGNKEIEEKIKNWYNHDVLKKKDTNF